MIFITTTLSVDHMVYIYKLHTLRTPLMAFWFGPYEDVLMFNFEVNEDGDNQSLLTHCSFSMPCFSTSIKRKELIGLTVCVKKKNETKIGLPTHIFRL